MLMQVAFLNLFRNVRRTIAVLTTVAVGAGSLFLYRGFNEGIMNQYRDNTIRCRYGHGQINQAGYREKVFEKPWEHWIDNSEALKAALLKVPGVEHVFPRNEFFALLTNGKITVSGRGQGVDGAEESKFFTTLNIESGVTLSDQADGILLGRGLARAMDVKPGDRITVMANTVFGSMNAADLTVTGIFHTGAKEFDDVVFRIPLKQSQILLDTSKVESVAVGLKNLEDWNSVTQSIQKDFPKLEATPFAILDKVYYQHSVDWLNSQFGIIQIIILTIVILGIFNTVSTGILERKQEIGNLRANGESKSEVLRLLTAEGLALGLIGAFLGVFLAWLFNSTLLRNGILMPPAPGLTRQFHVKIELQWMMAFISLGLGIVTATLGSWIAALKVVKTPVGDLLRSL